MFGIGRRNTPEAFRKACKRFIFIENLLSDGEELRETEEPGQIKPAEAKVPIAESEQRAASSAGRRVAAGAEQDGLHRRGSKAAGNESGATHHRRDAHS